MIVDFQFSPAGQPGRLTWTSMLGRQYAVEHSENLIQCETLEDGIPAEGALTSWTLPSANRLSTGAWRVRVDQ
jgi:hypothetical protein